MKNKGIIERAKAAQTVAQKQDILKELSGYNHASNKTINKVMRLCK